MAVRIRRNVWKLAPWDPILVWYAKAVADMQKRPLADPLGWRYQAAIHEYVRARDPFATSGEPLPPAADQTRFWNQCQHSSWYFLPWHRIYLDYFEAIVASHIVAAGGPEDWALHEWALPYWNYSDATNPHARSLPPAFFAPTLPDGTPNKLRVTQRNPGCNTGAIVATPAAVSLTSCLGQAQFQAGPLGGSPGFGGPRTGFNHSSGPIGDLERVPHGSMHNAVGGFMAAFNTAALDPIFWLHHANIDRLWVVWLTRNPLHKNPTLAAWLTAQRFDFHDEHGANVSHTPSDVLTTTGSPRPYDYDDVSDPLAAPHLAVPTAAAAGSGTPSGGGNMSNQVVPEMVGASDPNAESHVLAGGPTTVHVAMNAPSGPGLAARAAAPRPTYLNIENITSLGEGAQTNYEVYVNVPEGEDPRAHPELLAGLLPMFGVTEASRTDRDHPASGLLYALDVTDLVARLGAAGNFNPSELRVTFVPEPHPALPAAAAAPSTPPIRVGRVSLYVA